MGLRVPQIFDSTSHDISGGTSVAIPANAGYPTKTVVLSTDLSTGVFVKFGSSTAVTASATDAHLHVALGDAVVVECAGYTHIGYSTGAGRLVIGACE